MKVILWRRPDGGFSFTVPAGETEEQARAYAAKLQTDEFHSGYVVEGVCDETEMPDGGRFNKTSLAAAEFKGAWDCVGGRPKMVMERAVEIKKAQLRAMRAPLLASLDVDYMRALEQGLPTDAIIAEKQALRNVTADPSIAMATTAEELQAVLPEALR